MSLYSNFTFVVDEDVPSPKNAPRAVVLVIGWWGSKPKHLAKYTSLYKERNCVTVACIPKTLAVLFHHNPSFDALAVEAASRVATILRKHNEAIPVLIHSFSNGGAFVVDRLHVQIERANSQPESNEKQKQDLRLVAKCLESEFYDSGPVAVDAKVSYKAMSLVIKNPVALSILWLWFVFKDWRIWFMNYAMGMKSGEDIFWEGMTSNRICLKQVYVYSKEDVVTDPEKLEELIQTRQKLSDDILVKCFSGSPHVMHYKHYPKDYVDLIDKALASLVKK